jgi:hypothetical protein
MDRERYEPHAERAPGSARGVDHAVGDLATRQYGVVAQRQLLDLGLGRGAIARRARGGRLRRVHPGVYAVGHGALRPEGHAMAAVLACGPGAVLSHRSAAQLWGLRPHRGTHAEVSVPRAAARQLPGIRVHRRARLRPGEVTVVDGVPCTSLALTLLDLAAVIDRRGVERACDQAEVLELFDLRAVRDVLGRRAGQRGAGVLRAVLAEHAIGTTPTWSALEERFLGVCRRAGLPHPEVNAWLVLDGSAHRVDFLWRAARLVVETDGRRVHRTRAAVERDRARDVALFAAGYATVRCTWRQVTQEPGTIVRAVRARLG